MSIALIVIGVIILTIGIFVVYRLVTVRQQNNKLKKERFERVRPLFYKLENGQPILRQDVLPFTKNLLTRQIAFQLLVILAILFFGCSRLQEQKNDTGNSDTGNSDTLHRLTTAKSKFRLALTTICEQTKLSNQFDISISFKRYTDVVELADSCLLNLFLIDKTTKSILDSISITSLFLFGQQYSSCESLTSYSTKFRTDQEVVNNYFGDLVVADLNFDGKDDIAVISDYSGNADPFYSYFLQINGGKFLLDRFLTDSVTLFPTKIDRVKRMLVTYAHAGACCVGEHIYQFDPTGNGGSRPVTEYFEANTPINRTCVTTII